MDRRATGRAALQARSADRATGQKPAETVIAALRLWGCGPYAHQKGAL